MIFKNRYIRKGTLMQVFKIRLKLYLLQDIPANQVQEKIAAFIDTGLARQTELLHFHEENRYKNYCFDSLYPPERDKIYKKDQIYTVTIRTVDHALANYFSEVYKNHYTNEMKGLVTEICILPKKMIEFLYSLTPVVLKDEQGYWRDHMALEQFEERLKINLIKKWNYLTGEKLQEDFPLYTLLEFLNTSPVSTKYKRIHLLGDKLRLQIADHESAQKLAYMSLGTGMLEMNSRGYGYVNYRWL